MTEELAKLYDPKITEDKWYSVWQEHGLFHAEPDPKKKPFCIVIPPPNVTGILHMGHALNNTIQDILIRRHRMLGDETLWMPGTDHAGIATQNVVEKSIAKEGLKRQDLGREKFIERVRQWKEQYGSTIIRQLKKMGASCDWQRLRFTMDEAYSVSVAEVFVRLYESGLIYRGSYIINWCPRCQTALSDEEAPHHDVEGNLYHLKYPLEGAPGRFVAVATTRPETMLGDTAVAVNPKDKRYKKLAGKYLLLPLTGRKIKIIADNTVDMKFGTGAVKVTPAHDPNDYALGKKHGLEFINVMTSSGRMNDRAGDYRGMDRFEARSAIVEDLKIRGLLKKVEPHALSAGHCYRCHTIIEPYLSRQWFVRMKPLARPAIKAVRDGSIRFHPRRWTKVYLNWMENIQDWCVSRQIWWGHRLPVYYCTDCEKRTDEAGGLRPEVGGQGEKGVIVARSRPEKCPECGSLDIRQDEDVLDTWFSSWLWPFATFGWPKESADLKYFYPTSALVTAPEIIFFWVARMIMAGFKFMGKKPFSDVYIHGTVRDIEGRKMSKSLGNIIDPLEIIEEYGADALRFSLISATAQGQDVFLSKERFEQGRNFANKIWNASRFILMNLDKNNTKADLCVFFKGSDLNIMDRWILSRFYSTVAAVNKELENFRFNEAANLLYGFFWHEFCDWYLEMIKPRIKDPAHQLVMYKVLEKFLRVLHPIMPFITEEVWQRVEVSLRGRDSARSNLKNVIASPSARNDVSCSIMTQPWPHAQKDIIDKKTEKNMSFVFEVISGIRNMRAELELPLQDRITAYAVCSEKARRVLLEELRPQIEALCRAEFSVTDKFVKKPAEFAGVVSSSHIVIKLSQSFDVRKYLARIEQKLVELGASIRARQNLLANKAFVDKAPAGIVEKERAKLKETQDSLLKSEGIKHGFGR